MKKTAKLVSSILSILFLLSALAACSNADSGEVIPTGMKIATCTGADYRLYVPTSWNANTAYGISGAYYSMSRQTTVSVVRYPITDALRAELDTALADVPMGAERISAEVEYYAREYCLAAIRGQALEGAVETVEEPAPCLLEDVNARRYHYRAVMASAAGSNSGLAGENRSMQILQVVCERTESRAFYVFTFIADGEIYSDLLSDVERMLDEFIFFVPYQPDEYAKILEGDENAPDGMKLASNNEVAYRFYAPVDWTLNCEERIFSAYADDRSSVSVVPFMPETDRMTAAEFFALNREMMEQVGGADSFALIAETETTLGGRPAICFDYTYRIGTDTYRYRQFVVAYKGMIYNMTYTAEPENFEDHLSEVERMRAAFTFR